MSRLYSIGMRPRAPNRRIEVRRKHQTVLATDNGLKSGSRAVTLDGFHTHMNRLSTLLSELNRVNPARLLLKTVLNG
jgi:hypothetical protein